MQDLTFWLITASAFLGAFISASIGLGGAFILLAVTSATLPISTVVPIHSSLLIGGLISRIISFFPYVSWDTVKNFSFGCLFGVYIGAIIYIQLPDWLIAAVLSLIMFSVWLPDLKYNFTLKKPFIYVGFFHGVLSTLFSFGGVLHASILRLPLNKLQIIATGSCCLLTLATLKIIGYAFNGFDYGPYKSLIFMCFFVSFLGTLLGRFFVNFISEKAFRVSIKILMTIMGFVLLYKSGLIF